MIKEGRSRHWEKRDGNLKGLVLTTAIVSPIASKMQLYFAAILEAHAQTILYDLDLGLKQFFKFVDQIENEWKYHLQFESGRFRK